jgi:signal transduction histidine kinase/ActR/RegA family two-component response regulator
VTRPGPPSPEPRAGDPLDRYRQALAASEAAFRNLIDLNADGILVLRPSGEICFANPAAEALLGRPRAGLVGRPFGQPVAAGTTAVVDIPPTADHPEVRTAEMRCVGIAWEESPALLATLRDVTERKRNEEALAFLAEASRVLADSLDEPTVPARVARLAADHRCDCSLIDLLTDRFTLRPAALAHRSPAQEPAWRERFDGLPPEVDPGVATVRVLCRGVPCAVPALPGTLTAATPDEHPRLLRQLPFRSYLCVPLVTQGRTLGVLTLVRVDDTRRFGPAELSLAEDFARRAAAAIGHAQLYWKTQEENRRKAEFLAMLGHELRNPLGAIRNALQVRVAAREVGAAGDSGVRADAVVSRQVAHMTRLVDDLLEVSRVTRGMIQLRREAVDLGEVLRRTAETCRPLLDGPGHRLVLDVPPGLPAVEGDPDRLEQVFGNLLHNAAKYTDPGGRIEVRARAADDGMVAVEVADTGIGIPASVLPNLFDLFSTAPQELCRSRGGLGIGLTLVQRLVAMHGGTVTALSPGERQGSVFTVRLPAAARGPQRPPGPDGGPRENGRRGGRRVLVVEDNADNRAMVRELLTFWGHRVEEASDGEEGVRKALAGRPEAALIDIGLPGCDGYEVARRIRGGAGPAAGGPFLIAMTGYGHADDRRKALAAGFDVHLVKPVNLDALARLLTELKAPSGGEPSDGEPAA